MKTNIPLKIQTLKNTDLKKRRRQKALSVMITDGSTPTATLLFWGAIVFGLTVGLLLSAIALYVIIVIAFYFSAASGEFIMCCRTFAWIFFISGIFCLTIFFVLAAVIFGYYFLLINSGHIKDEDLE